MNPLGPFPEASPLPFNLAVSGHRDPHPADVQAVEVQVSRLLRIATSTLANTTVHCMSALADGADQLFGQQVSTLMQSPDLGNRLSLTVCLPMPIDQYVFEQAGGAMSQQTDPLAFAKESEAFSQRFNSITSTASASLVVPNFALDFARKRTSAESGDQGNAPYARLGRYLNIHANLLVAIWDGKDQFERKPGGTLDVVLSCLEGFDRVNEPRSARRLSERERAEAVHIPTRRRGDTSSAQPAAMALIEKPSKGIVRRTDLPVQSKGVARAPLKNWFLSPLLAAQTWSEHRIWLNTLNRVRLALPDLSEAECAIAHHIWLKGQEIDHFNALHWQRLRANTGYPQALADSRRYFLNSLPSPDTDTHQQQVRALAPMLRAFAASDVLAAVAQRQWIQRWRWIALGALLAAGSSGLKVLYPPIEQLGFFAGATVAIAVYWRVSLSMQRNAYLEYRAIAEGLRFQMYWLVSGESALVTDHYVQKFRKDLGWIRGTLDALTAQPAPPPSDAIEVAKGWIQDQLSYLNGRTVKRRKLQNERANTYGNNLLLTGAALGIAAIAWSASWPIAAILFALVAGMKLFSAAGATWLSYNSKLGNSEFLKQCEHLRGVYTRAKQTLEDIEKDQAVHAATQQAQALDLMIALGKEALAENANWLSTYLQRKVTWHGK